MIRYLSLEEVLDLHRLVIEQSGGSDGILNLAGLESAVAQPQMTFGGEDLYPTLMEKAAALGFSLTQNHPFVDGNKRIGHAAMETSLILNGREIAAGVDEQEDMVIRLASGDLGREELVAWMVDHTDDLPR